MIVVLNIGLLSWSLAQGSRSDLFDKKKVDQELEIMKGILGTTLDFALRDLQAPGTGKASDERHLVHAWGWNNMSGFYLYGQGATFIIPTSELAIPWHRAGRITLGMASLESGDVAYAEAMETAQEAMQDAQAELVDVQAEFRDQLEEAAEAAREAQEAGSAVAAPVSPATLAPTAVAPVAPARPPRPAVKGQAAPQPKPDQEAIRKRVAAAQEKVKKRQEVLEQRRQKFQETLAQLKVHLVEALANHGDSLTCVKPNEYINLVLSTDIGGGLLSGGDGGSERDIISIQKSVVSDYKAGRLTLEAFRQKVLQYAN